MALNLTNSPVSPSTTARTQVYVAPTGVTGTVFDGTVSNTDTTNKAVHYVTFELEDTGVFRTLVRDMAVPYGVSPRFPKVVVKPGQKIHVTIDQANTIDVLLSIAERS